MHVAGLARHQRDVGCDVDVITVGGVVNVAVTRGQTAHSTGASFSRRVVMEATRAVLDGGCDVVHTHAGLATPLTFAAARAASLAGVVTVVTVVTVHSMIGRLSALYRSLDLVTHWREWPVAWSAVSQVAAEPLRSLLGPSTRVDVVPNAVDVDRWSLGVLVPRVEREIVVAAVMRLAPRKRPIPLLRILPSNFIWPGRVYRGLARLSTDPNDASEAHAFDQGLRRPINGNQG